MAMEMAAQYYPIKLFYVIPRDYTHPCEIITKGARGIIDIPSINLRKVLKLNKKQKQLILLLGEDEQTFTELAKRYAKISEIKIDREKMKTLKAWLFYHIKSMKEKGLISTKIKEKIMFVRLTKTGAFIKLITEKEQPALNQTRLKFPK